MSIFHIFLYSHAYFEFTLPKKQNPNFSSIVFISGRNCCCGSLCCRRSKDVNIFLAGAGNAKSLFNVFYNIYPVKAGQVNEGGDCLLYARNRVSRRGKIRLMLYCAKYMLYMFLFSMMIKLLEARES